MHNLVAEPSHRSEPRNGVFSMLSASGAGSLVGTLYDSMKHRHVFLALLTMALISGCSTHPSKQEAQASAPRPPLLLSVTEPALGKAYELGVYVIQKGDTIALICRHFQLSVRDFLAMNPEVNPTRLLIGQQVRIREAIKD